MPMSAVNTAQTQVQWSPPEHSPASYERIKSGWCICSSQIPLAVVPL
jgi:hypothetical protein